MATEKTPTTPDKALAWSNLIMAITMVILGVSLFVSLIHIADLEQQIDEQQKIIKSTYKTY